MKLIQESAETSYSFQTTQKRACELGEAYIDKRQVEYIQQKARQAKQEVFLQAAVRDYQRIQSDEEMMNAVHILHL